MRSTTSYCAVQQKSISLVPMPLRATQSLLPPEALAVIEGRHHDPFQYLGPHTEGGVSVVRVFLPEASDVSVITETGHIFPLPCLHPSGLFAGPVPNAGARYRLQARHGSHLVEMEDAYRFLPLLSDFDLMLLAEGTQARLTDKLGAHPCSLDGAEGVSFAVFAPNARRVSV